MYGKVFASIYNSRWVAFGKRVSPLVLGFYERQGLLQNKSVLDLCCGTGVFSAYALEKGYDVTGLDASSDMLRWAETNTRSHVDAGRARYVAGRAEDFAIDREFGLCVSLFDSLNHLTGMDQLLGCSLSVHRVVSPGGYFVFDLNTKRFLLAGWNSVSVTDEPDLMLVNRGIYVPGWPRALVKISGFARNEEGHFERFDENMWNTAFDMTEVAAMLRDTGWEHVHAARADSLDTPLDDPEAESRVFFVARKAK